MSDPQTEVVSSHTADAIVQMLMITTQGPSQAYATLCLAIWKISKMNEEQTNEEITMDQLVEEVSMSLRSITPASVN